MPGAGMETRRARSNDGTDLSTRERESSPGENLEFLSERRQNDRVGARTRRSSDLSALTRELLPHETMRLGAGGEGPWEGPLACGLLFPARPSPGIGAWIRTLYAAARRPFQVSFARSACIPFGELWKIVTSLVRVPDGGIRETGYAFESAVSIGLPVRRRCGE